VWCKNNATRPKQLSLSWISEAFPKAWKNVTKIEKLGSALLFILFNGLLLVMSGGGSFLLVLFWAAGLYLTFCFGRKMLNLMLKNPPEKIQETELDSSL